MSRGDGGGQKTMQWPMPKTPSGTNLLFFFGCDVRCLPESAVVTIPESGIPQESGNPGGRGGCEPDP